MNTIDDYKDRFDSPIGITNVRGPHVIDKVVIEFAVENIDDFHICLPGERFKERITITHGRVSYKITRFVEDKEHEEVWEYKSTSEKFCENIEEVFEKIIILENVNDYEYVRGSEPILFTIYYKSGENKKLTLSPESSGMELLALYLSTLFNFGHNILPELLKLY